MKTVPDTETLIQLAADGRWPEARANDWHDRQPWLVGCNFLPSYASNQLEMWQAETFDPAAIDRELSWLAKLGMNTARVFLHDLLWQQDRAGFLVRIEKFLAIADRHGIRAMLVFFDSCWHPFPRLGKQPEPEAGVHNSRWVQSPGVTVLKNPAAFGKLRAYVSGVVRQFRDDPRVCVWDLWNEPDNANAASYAPRDFPTMQAKGAVVLPLLARVFQWARAARPSQPLTAGVWWGDWDAPLPRLQLAASDVISFHNYEPLTVTRRKVQTLRRCNRPLLCTEYMARSAGSTFATHLPWFKRERIAAYNWGSVAGRSQTQYPWDSWQKSYPREPQVWFHDIFRSNGKPYRAAESRLIGKLTGKIATKKHKKNRNKY